MENILTIDNKIRVKEIIILAAPAILEMGLNTMLGLADTLMISHIIGKEGLAAVGFANQIIFTLIFVFSSFNAGATAMIARSYGENDYRKLNTILGQNITLNLIMGTVIFIFSFTMARNILHIYDISENVLLMGTTYLKIIACGQLFMFLSLATAAALRGAGNTKTPMYITGTANIINIAGNYVFLTGYSIFPTLGIAGVALATTFARIIAAALYLYIIIRGTGGLKLYLNNMKLTRRILLPLWNLSYAAGLEQLSMQLAFIANGIIVSRLDTTAEAAFRIIINIESISYMPAIGFAIATTTLVGKHLGEERTDESLKTGFTAASLGIIWGLSIGLLFFLLPGPIARLFTADVDILKVSLTTIRIVGLNQAPLSFMIIMAGALRGAGDTRGVMIITALRLWLMFVPLSYFFVIILNRGIAGVWFAEILSFMVFSLIIFKRFRKMKWARIKIFARS